MGQTANGKLPAPIGIDVYNNIKPIIGDSHILEWPSTRWYGKYWNHLERADFFHQLRMALCVGSYGWQRYSCEWNCSAIAAEYKIREFSQQNDPNNFWFLNSTWTSKMSSNVFWYLQLIEYTAVGPVRSMDLFWFKTPLESGSKVWLTP